MEKTDIKFMKQALKEAQKAALLDEVPVGCVIVKDAKIIARGHNLKEKNSDPLAHAEIVAIKKATKKLDTWRLNECELYVTVEPCAMCAGAIMWSRFKRVIFGTYDIKGGAMGKTFNLFDQKIVNHSPAVVTGVLEEECKAIIQEFFRNKRK